MTSAAGPDPLATYNRKRDFTKTTEPAGKVARKAGAKPVFMVQKHDATRLHWDLRLEVDGVLKSWAVTRGPSADPEDKRLAVRTEDHPMSYATFEGTIPEREYGGGTVMLWDRGTWEPVPGKSAADLAKGHLHFIVHGERMQGEWLLVRLKPRGKEKGENWLLRKIADDHARTGDVLVETALTSVSSGRTMAEIAAGKPPRKPARSAATSTAKADAKAVAAPRRAPRRKAAKAMSLPTPGFREPMLATLSKRVPTGDDWWYEIKFDGYRCLLAVGADGVRCWTRSGLDWQDRYGPIPGAAARLPCASALIDGEVVAMGDNGLPSFSALQHQLKQPSPDLLFFAFDLLDLDGENLESLSLAERKARLERLMDSAADPLRLSVHTRGDGAALFAALVDEGHEGLVAKRADGPYVHARSGGWLKVKAARREEFVIVGWEPSDKHGRAIRSVLLAQQDGGRLSYKGKVGTGFDEDAMADLCRRFADLARKGSPLADRTRVPGKPRWLDPVLVAEVRYAELTADGAVRHGVFMGLREDKPAAEVAPEREGGAGADAAPDAPLPRADFPVTNADRPIFGEGGPTKGDLAAWYAAVAPHALRWLAGRPLSLVRCPQGISGQCFFQKHLKEGWGEELDSVMVRHKDGTEEPVFVVHDAAGLLRCVQMGTIEFHGWGAPAAAIECPDRLVFDLDPDVGLDFEAVRAAAFDLHDHLAEMGLVTFPMVTGGKGVHVIAPLDGTAGWDAVEDFAHRFARALEQAEPDRFTANLSKARRKGRIFVDYLRNQRGSTAVMPWSARARLGAPVATPLGWEELRTIASPAQFTLDRPAALLARAAALDPGWGVAAQPLPDA